VKARPPSGGPDRDDELMIQISACARLTPSFAAGPGPREPSRRPGERQRRQHDQQRQRRQIVPDMPSLGCALCARLDNL
jgi:hypothetical protein